MSGGQHRGAYLITTQREGALRGSVFHGKKGCKQEGVFCSTLQIRTTFDYTLTRTKACNYFTTQPLFKNTTSECQSCSCISVLTHFLKSKCVTRASLRGAGFYLKKSKHKKKLLSPFKSWTYLVDKQNSGKRRSNFLCCFFLSYEIVILNVCPPVPPCLLSLICQLSCPHFFMAVIMGLSSASCLFLDVSAEHHLSTSDLDCVDSSEYTAQHDR